MENEFLKLTIVPAPQMRLDLFLKSTRLCPRRTVAQKLCDAGLVFVNDKPAKSAHAVKPGDEITLRRRERAIRVRVLALPGSRQTSRQEAKTLHEILSEHLESSATVSSSNQGE